MDDGSMKPKHPNPKGAVYRHINAAGETLYIGCSINPMARFMTHRSQSSWATEVVRIDVIWFATHAEALAEELRLIRAEDPPHNRQFRVKKRTWPTNEGHLVLSQWMDRTGFTLADIARALGCPTNSLKHLLTPSAHPRYRKAEGLSIVTGGYVPGRVWHHGSKAEDITEAEAAQHYANAIRLHAGWRLPAPKSLVRPLEAAA
jgi:hypothetical protein